MTNSYININHIDDKGTKVLGPGLRYVIWTQGCPFNCYNCASPETRPIKKSSLVPIEVLYQSIVENNNIDGISISGGEPFIQASKLIILLEAIKKSRPELNVIIYTGFSLEDFDWKEAQQLVGLVDVLIDGKYIDSMNDNKGLRGSSNQRIHFLTDVLFEYKDLFESGNRNSEIYIHDFYKRIIGIPIK